MRVDLHVHSTASDGELPPAGVVACAQDVGLDVIALTDHDTVLGVVPAREAAERLRVVAGCEFSVRAPWGEMHLLAYFLPTEHPDLTAFLHTQQAARAARMDEIVRRLRAAGAGITRAAVQELAGSGALGRPHAARALVAAGLVPDLDTAFRRYLGRGRPGFVAKRLPPVTAVTALVRRLGGVTSAAHLKDRGGRGALDRLRALGVDAVEARHPSHDPETTARIERAAQALSMPCTGGSDWHGDTEADAPRRAPLGGVDVPAEWFAVIESMHRARYPSEIPT